MSMNKLKEVRFFRRISQFRLSNTVGIAASKLSLVENDLVTLKPDEEKKIADFFQLPVEEIFPPQENTILPKKKSGMQKSNSL
jgi:DNA-binding XRE family transcriptional regulator